MKRTLLALALAAAAGSAPIEPAQAAPVLSVLQQPLAEAAMPGVEQAQYYYYPRRRYYRRYYYRRYYRRY